MNRLLAILVASALAGGAYAADSGVKKVAEQAKATYEMDKKGCKGMPKDEQQDCLHRARAEYDQQVAGVREMKKEEDKQDAAARAEKRDAKKRLGEHSGSDYSYKQDKKLGKVAESGKPGRYMGYAPETAGPSPSAPPEAR